MRRIEKFKYLPFYLVSLVPFSLLYILSDFFYFVIYHVIGYRKQVVQENLRIAFPELSDNERQIIERKFYQHFCDLMVESIKGLSIQKNHLLKRIKIINPDILEKFQYNDKSFILYSGHLGNWEWMLSFPLVLKPKILTFYLPLSNAYFSNLITAIRGRFGVVSIEAGRGYKTLLQYSANKKTSFTLFLADQSPHKDTRMHWTKFFNTDTAFNTGINTMARKLEMVVLFPYYRKIARGYYEVELVELWNGQTELSENEIIDTFANKLEVAIKESPHLWLWTHRRWKLDKSKIIKT